MRPFTYDALPGRVVFGFGASRERLVGEVERLGVGRVLLVTTERGKAIAGPLGDRVAGVFTGVEMHVPVEVARSMARETKSDGLLSIGGAPTALKDIGMKEEGLDEAVSLVLRKAPEDNPRPVDEAGVRTILEGAFFGRRPGLVAEKSF